MRQRLLLFGLALVALLASVAVANATTGSINGYPQPKVYVPYGKAVPFEGRFVLTEVGRGASLRSGEVKIEFPEAASPKFLAGAAAFYEYNSLGETETALFALYPFRPVPDGVRALVRNQGLNGHLGETLKVGNLTLFTPTDGETIEGELEFHGGTYEVAFERLPEDSTIAANLRPAKQLTEESKAPNAAGWGPEPADYEGSYALTNAAPDPTEGAGILAPVIGVAQGLGTTGTTVSAGRMTVSGGGSPSAVVDLETGGTKRTYYLSDLGWQGDLRVAKVHDGGSQGRVVGEFEGREKSPGELKGTLEAGASRFEVSFKRDA